MSTPLPTSAPTKRPSAAGRYFFMLLLGLVLGAIATVMLMRAWNARQDHFPDSLMNVMSWHMGKLKGNLEQNRCSATDTIPHLQALRAMGNNLEPGFAKLADDQRFKDHSAKFRAALDNTIANPPLSCESLKASMGEVGGSCKSCHDDFKS